MLSGILSIGWYWRCLSKRSSNLADESTEQHPASFRTGFDRCTDPVTPILFGPMLIPVLISSVLISVCHRFSERAINLSLENALKLIEFDRILINLSARFVREYRFRIFFGYENMKNWQKQTKREQILPSCKTLIFFSMLSWIQERIWSILRIRSDIYRF